MIIIGIDPGYAIVGIGVVEYVGNKFRTLEYNAITTPAGMPTVERLKKIYTEMTMYIDKYKPDAVAIEELFFNSNQKTAKRCIACSGGKQECTDKRIYAASG